MKTRWLLLLSTFISCIACAEFNEATVTKADKKLFIELTLKKQFGSLGPKPQLTRWEEPVGIQLLGNPSAEDKATVAQVCNEINTLLGKELYTVIEGYAGIRVHFIDLNEFSDILPDSKKSLWAVFKVIPAAETGIFSSTILIADQLKSRETRDGSIRAMLTRSLGLLGTSKRFEQSPFSPTYKRFSTTYSPIDEKMIRLLYSEMFLSGMEYPNVRKALESIGRIDDEPNPAEDP